MRIGIDTGCWLNGRGYGRFTRELSRAISRESGDGERLIFFLDPETERSFDIDGHNVDRVVVAMKETPSSAAVTGSRRSVVDMLRLSRAVAGQELDVFFFPSVYSFFPVPPWLRTVVGLHDTIAERFPELTLPSFRDRTFWRLKVGVALRQARLVMTVSGFSASEIAEVHDLPRERLRIVSEAPSAAYQPPTSTAEVAAAGRRVGLPAGARWFTYVGGFNPHKRLDVLIRAHASLVREDPESAPYLLLVGSLEGGGFHQNRESLLRLIRSEGAADQVVWTGYVPDEELRLLHAGALAAVLPSEAEGFGLPAVEAAACGAPVVATRRSPLPELLQGGGIFVEPGDVAALAAALRLMARNTEKAEEMGRRARRMAAKLSWDRSARTALAALREAAA